MKVTTLTALALALALAALPGCLFKGAAPQRPIIIEAYHLPEKYGEFIIGSTTQDEVMSAIGAPGAVEVGAGDHELWLYYPGTTETVYLITFKTPEGEKHFKYAPSNRQTLSLVFSNGKLVGI
ncbi:MAG: hypothetical protein LBR80_03995 [Deltaproteobacteria bacterium]|nr:hypothetical protein [Deltaproteobacteria bacterium]